VWEGVEAGMAWLLAARLGAVIRTSQ